MRVAAFGVVFSVLFLLFTAQAAVAAVAGQSCTEFGTTKLSDGKNDIVACLYNDDQNVSGHSLTMSWRASSSRPRNCTAYYSHWAIKGPCGFSSQAYCPAGMYASGGGSWGAGNASFQNSHPIIDNDASHSAYGSPYGWEVSFLDTWVGQDASGGIHGCTGNYDPATGYGTQDNVQHMGTTSMAEVAPYTNQDSSGSVPTFPIAQAYLPPPGSTMGGAAMVVCCK
jgi:hypothetical protein